MLSTDQLFNDFTVRGGLGEFARMLEKSREITVAFIGGSVTVGAGASDVERTSYRARICENLRCRFPQIAFTFINAAIGGTDSSFGAFRIKSQVLQAPKVDLLFVEFAVNDGGNRTASIRAMEGIVRQARRLHPSIDILFVYTANEKAAEAFKVSGQTQSNVQHHEEVAECYRLPSVNIAKHVYRLLAEERLSWSELSGDSVHPNDFGYSLYAQCLETFLNEALNVAPAAAPERSALPTPLDKFCYENADLVSPAEIKQAAGWEMLQGWTAEAVCNWTPPADIFVGHQPGDRFRLEFHGTAIGFSLLAGMDTGSIEYSLDGGEFQTVELFDDYCLSFYRPKIVLLADRLNRERHTVDIRISHDKHAASAGHAVRILNLLVNS